MKALKGLFHKINTTYGLKVTEIKVLLHLTIPAVINLFSKELANAINTKKSSTYTV